MLIDGKMIAERVYERLGPLNLTLGILIVGSDSVTDSFVKTKEKAAARLQVAVVRSELPTTVSTDDVLFALAKLSSHCDGVIVQLPLPVQVDVDAVLSAIDPPKDVDGLSADPRVRPPVAAAVEELLEAESVHVFDEKAVVVGAGRLVGKPCASLLADLGAHVTVLTKGDSLDALRDASIAVLGAGQPGMVRPEHISNGVVLIDAGTSESSGKVVGDADPSCVEKASLITPVPGGIGPIAIAKIFENLHTLAKK